MTGHPDLNAMARRVIDANHYTAARYSDFYSTALLGDGEAVYLAASARPIRDDELEAVCPEAFRTTAGARRFEPDELHGGSPLRLYAAHVESCEVHVAGSHPVHGRGIDTRQPADPTAA